MMDVSDVAKRGAPWSWSSWLPRFRWLRAGCLLTSLAVAGCGSDQAGPLGPGAVRNTDFTAAEAFSATRAVGGHAGVRLEGINGSVTLTGDAGASVAVNAIRQVSSDSLADAQANLAQLQVEILDLGTEILIRTTQPRDSGGRNFVVDYRVMVPAALEFTISNVNGAVGVAGMTGGGSVSLVNGTIDAALDLPPAGEVDLTTTNGNVLLEVPLTTSATLSARLTNGTITVTNLTLHDETRTSRSLEGTLGGGDGRISLMTTNGSIRVTGD